MVNAWTVPKPLDTNQLIASLAETLRIYPLNASQLAKNPSNGKWQLQLINQAIPLTIGTSQKPGLFGPSWNGERDTGEIDGELRIQCESRMKN